MSAAWDFRDTKVRAACDNRWVTQFHGSETLKLSGEYLLCPVLNLVRNQTCPSLACGQGNNFSEHLLGCARAAIVPAHGFKRSCVASGVFSGASILDLGDEEAPISRIPDCTFHTLIRHDAVNDQVLDAEIAQHIFNVGGIENPG